MALGKLWNALFGKPAVVAADLPLASPAQSTPQQTGERTPSARPPKLAIAAGSASGGLAQGDQERIAGHRPATGVKKNSGMKRGRKPAAPPQIAVAPVTEAPPQRSIRVARPQKNAWTKLVSGRQIGCILDTQLGDASRAVEILQAIVCDAVPTPKYVAIDLFELGSGALSVMEFHQRIRRAGGQAVAIPADLATGLRQLSQTLGTVDLVLLDASASDLTQLELRRLLARVTHSESLVLQQDQRGKWQTVEALGPPRQRVIEARLKAA